MIQAVVLDLFGTLGRLGRDSKPVLKLARAIRPDDPASVLRGSLVTDAPGLGDLAAAMGASPPTELPGWEADLHRDLETFRTFDDVIEALTELRSTGVTMGLISNLASPYKEPFFRLGLDQFFNACLFSCDVGRVKPDPELFLKVADDLQYPPDRLVMVGDRRRADYDGPLAVGMRAILLERGGSTPGLPSIESLRELPGLIREGRA